MVSCKLKGRLGNQLFQLAAAMSYAIDTGNEFYLPMTTGNEKEWPHYFRDKWAGKKYGGPFDEIYKEPSHAYTKIPRMDGRILLDGYFQSYKYLESNIQIIREAFAFDNFTNYGWVSIHVRRGDYLQHPTKHPVVTMDYLKEAVSKFSEDISFQIFSDDLPWCKQNLNKEFFDAYAGGRDFEYEETTDPISDIHYMAMAEHNIVANSSFSVMAALMNNNHRKIVVCPDEGSYFGKDNKHLDVSTLMPNSWKRVKF